MTQTTVVTPLNYQTPVGLVRIGGGMRLLAAVIDALIAGIARAVVVLVLSLVVGVVVASIIGALLVIAYFSLEVIRRQSPAKMMFKYVITGQSGAPATQDQLIKRFAYKQIPQILILLAALPFGPLSLIFSIIGLIAWLVIVGGTLLVLQPEKLALHDKLFGTAVFGPATTTVTMPQFNTAGGASVPPPPAV